MADYAFDSNSSCEFWRSSDQAAIGSVTTLALRLCDAAKATSFAG
jgi:hypothetical protein